MSALRKLLPLIFLAASMPAKAMDAGFEGYADLRLVLPADESSWLNGGLGKTRYGAGNGNFQFAELVGQGHVLFTPELSLVAVGRVESHQRIFADLLEAYMRYRPVSTTAWRWQVKVGAFFPPISLENSELGWTSYWTLTPSAINSWVGDELRTIGAEGKLEWRRERGTLALTGAMFGWNDPAGVMIADRGWAFDDRPTGLFDHLREPNATAIEFGTTPPLRTAIFEEIDHRIGWYTGLSFDDAALGHFEALYYDNSANASKDIDDVYAWRTNFWSAGYRRQFGEYTLMVQGLTGETIITPAPHFSSVTDYDAAYVLLGWEGGNWRLAVRADIFDTSQHNPGIPLRLGEHGEAFTLAASWLPYDWLRLTAEFLLVDSTRDERSFTGLDPRQLNRQLQLSARVYF